jgi:hypothetical protein
VFNIGIIIAPAFHFNDDGYAVGEPDKEVGFINVGVVIHFVGDVKFQSVVADVANNDSTLRQLLKLTARLHRAKAAVLMRGQNAE